MNSQRWQQIDELFQATVELDPAQRASFLEHECAGDQALRSAVESMLASDADDWNFVEKPALEVAAALFVDEQPQLASGDAICHYRVVAAIGRGGMGEVYLAEDEKLGRKVALKLLTAEFANDPSRMRRFQQEARAASALNHPNILTIHEITEDADHHFIATEFIEGETLRRRMQRGSLSLNETLDIAVQVSSALAAAHQAGIIHRDIKPENIMLRTDGYVKVLDFGLAKLAEQEAPEKAEENGNVTTEHSSGLLMGTLHYMSPEQARREPVDTRSDIFSFGVVLYEMLAGCRPFEADSVAALFIAISNFHLTPLKQKFPEAPKELLTIINKALCQDRDERYQSMAEMVESLKRLKQEISSSKEPNRNIIHSLSQRPFKKGLLTNAAIMIATLALLIFFVINYKGRKTKSHFQKVKISALTNNGKARDAAISPDGRYVAYVVEESQHESLWLKQIGTGESRELVQSQGVRYAAVSFAPDSNSVYFVKYEKTGGQNALFQVGVSGGEAKRVIAEVHSTVSFSPDGARVAFIRHLQGERGNALMIAKSDGTDEQEIGRHVQPEFFEDYPSGPAWSPRGDNIACGVQRHVSGQAFLDRRIIEVNLNDRSEKIINSTGVNPACGVKWLADGSGLIAISLDCQESKFPSCATVPFYIPYPNGEPRQLIQITQLNEPNLGYVGVSVNNNSTMVVTDGRLRQNNIWTAMLETPSQIKQVTEGDGNVSGHWTPDGRIVYSSGESGNPEIWIMDADGTNKKQLTFDPSFDQFPVPSPDGKYIVFYSDRAGTEAIWRMDMDGSNAKQLVTIDKIVGDCPVISPDGKWVVYDVPKGRQFTVWKVSIDGGEPVQLTDKDGRSPAVSPDGKLIAYTYQGLKSDSNMGIAIMPFTGGEAIKHFELPLGFVRRLCRWTPDGRGIICMNDLGGVSNLWVQPIDGSALKPLTDFKSNSIYQFDLSSDGRKIIYHITSRAENVFLISEDE